MTPKHLVLWFMFFAVLYNKQQWLLFCKKSKPGTKSIVQYPELKQVKKSVILLLKGLIHKILLASFQISLLTKIKLTDPYA